MVIHINLSKAEDLENGDAKANVHLLPCTIRSDCEANVSKYFDPIISKSCDGLTASFRGYPLMGQEVEVPAGYRGFVLYEANEKLSEGVDRCIYVSSSFSNFQYWNYDKTPTSNDGIRKALNWISLAKVIHSPTESS